MQKNDSKLKSDCVELLMLSQRLKDAVEDYIRMVETQSPLSTACTFLVSVLDLFEEIVQAELEA